MQDLENQFRSKKKLMVDDALSKLHEKYDKLRDSLSKQHQEELAALQVLWSLLSNYHRSLE